MRPSASNEKDLDERLNNLVNQLEAQVDSKTTSNRDPQEQEPETEAQ